MGLHTWCLKKVDLTIAQGIEIVLNKIEREMKLIKEALNYFYDGKVIDWIDPECDIKEEILIYENQLNYYRRIRNGIKLGQIREAALKLDFRTEGFDYYHRPTKTFYDKTDYHNIFRTSKCDDDDTYTDDQIFSKEGCEIWLNKNYETVYYINEERINKFWEEFPDGMIYFG